MEERIVARGHDNVTATHESTVEVTTDDYLTPAGDCIVGIDADRSPAAFDPEFRSACRHADSTITMTLRAGGITDRIVGRGDPELALTSDRSLVARTSTYIDDRTVLVDADRAATALDRGLVSALAEGADLETVLEVGPGTP